MSFAVKSSVPFFNIFMAHKLSSHQAAAADAAFYARAIKMWQTFLVLLQNHMFSTVYHQIYYF